MYKNLKRCARNIHLPIADTITRSEPATTPAGRDSESVFVNDVAFFRSRRIGLL